MDQRKKIRSIGFVPKKCHLIFKVSQSLLCLIQFVKLKLQATQHHNTPHNWFLFCLVDSFFCHLIEKTVNYATQHRDKIVYQFFLFIVHIHFALAQKRVRILV